MFKPLSGWPFEERLSKVQQYILYSYTVVKMRMIPFMIPLDRHMFLHLYNVYDPHLNQVLLYNNRSSPQFVGGWAGDQQVSGSDSRSGIHEVPLVHTHSHSLSCL